ncbi:viral capsid protein [Discula destructiva virus 1]|uniref:Viral capsid protein n=1 Tax=Discula destructiva virus 1 TaxID=148880 RepID=Q99D90_9VIRU|nr:viral capsid protein [Discula destructiva virus 1]AAK13165.1 viral capsid protein [Discula destructiva virus 1]
MADNQSQISQSVNPSDAASGSGKKRSKLGKAERLARRSAVGSQPGQSASAAKAAMFSAGGMVPKPTPGKFPVVFQTGAGEPARDQTFSLNERVLRDTVSKFPERFTYNAKYAEFKAHAEIDDDQFSRDLLVSALLRLAQQLVHSHVNMGLPQGDFSSVATTDVKVPGSVSAFITQYGEHSVPALGTRFLLSGYEESVRSVIWAADQISRGVNGDPIGRAWLPVRSQDRHTKQIVSARLGDFLLTRGVSISPEVLENALFSGNPPDIWEDIHDLWGDTDDRRERFDFLFKVYPDAPSFLVAFTTTAASAVLRELNLEWSTPVAGHLDWTFNAKEVFNRLSDEWAKKSATYALFFELSSSQSNRSAATGSQSQMAVVTSVDSVTVVKTHLALSAPEFSLVACFPASGVYSGNLSRRVVVTTPLSVLQRATEFVQMDWR